MIINPKKHGTYLNFENKLNNFIHLIDKNMINKHLKENTNDVRKIIGELAPNVDDIFTSHQFIGSFMAHFETDYISFLNYKVSKEKDAAIFKEVNNEISIALRNNSEEFGIEKVGRMVGVNVHQNESSSAAWRRVK